MRLSVKTITPAQAKKLLEKNTKNRPLSQAHVKFLCGVIERDEWKLNGDAIRYNNDVLIDGQHRLAACVESGISIQSVVIDGIDSDVFDTIDTGKNRSGADVLAIANISNYTTVASGLSIINYVNTGFQKKISNIQMENLYEIYPDISASAKVGGRARKLLSAGVVSGLHCLFARVDQTRADHFFDSLISGESLKRKDPVLVLRDRLLKNKESYSKLNNRQIVQIIIKAWNAYIRDEKISYLVVNGNMPEIKSGLELK